ncbi:MAG: membrane protein insertase YidC [Candidatus Edwardsbacteria bacterium]
MNTEKRMFLTLFLIFVIFFTWYLLFPPPKKELPKRPAIEEKEVVATPESAKVAGLKPAPTSPTNLPLLVSKVIEPATPTADKPEREITVETLNYNAVFTTIGATLKSFQLKNYPDSLGHPLQLIPEGKRNLGLLLFPQEKETDLSDVIFQSSSQNIVLAESQKEGDITFETSIGESVLVRKKFHFYDKKFQFSLQIEIENPQKVDLGRRYELGWQSGLRHSEKNKREDMNYFGVISLLGTELATDRLGEFHKKPKISHTGNIGFTGVRTKYFLAAIIPDSSSKAEVSRGEKKEEGILSAFLTRTITERVNDRWRIFVGPIDADFLKTVGCGLEIVADTGPSWLRWLTRFILQFLLILHQVIPNYGVVIIVFSLVVNILFFPLTFSSMKSMREMQRLQPKLKQIQQQYKKDPHRLQQETMKLYKEHHVNPFGGCLPLLIQIPVFISLYNVLKDTVKLRGAHFVLWIKDLSVPDAITYVNGFPIAILPILMGAVMFFQQKMTITDPRQKMMIYMMPVMMTVIFYNFPSGLVLYWLTSSILSMAEQYLLIRQSK